MRSWLTRRRLAVAVSLAAHVLILGYLGSRSGVERFLAAPESRAPFTVQLVRPPPQSPPPPRRSTPLPPRPRLSDVRTLSPEAPAPLIVPPQPPGPPPSPLPSQPPIDEGVTRTLRQTLGCRYPERLTAAERQACEDRLAKGAREAEFIPPPIDRDKRRAFDAVAAGKETDREWKAGAVPSGVTGPKGPGDMRGMGEVGNTAGAK